MSLCIDTDGAQKFGFHVFLLPILKIKFTHSNNSSEMGVEKKAITSLFSVLYQFMLRSDRLRRLDYVVVGFFFLLLSSSSPFRVFKSRG